MTETLNLETESVTVMMDTVKGDTLKVQNGIISQDSSSKEDALFGVFLSLLSLSWFIQYTFTRRRILQSKILHVVTSSTKPSKTSNSSGPSSSSPSTSLKSSLISRITSSLPWCGIFSLFISGLSIIITVVLPSTSSSFSTIEDNQQIETLQRVTMYLTFSIPGLLSTLGLMFSTSLSIPYYLTPLATTLAFLLEIVLFSKTASSLLLMAIFGCLLLSMTRFLTSSSSPSSSSLLLCLLTQLQGSWLLHTFISNPPPTWAPIYFSWHIIIIFILYTILLIIIQSRNNITPSPTASSTSSSSSSSTSAPSSSTTTLSSCASVPLPSSRPEKQSQLFYEKEGKEINREKIQSVLARIDDMMEGRHSASLDTSQDTLSEEVDTKERERLSPLEEWNTLHRCVTQNRASIKLKESSIV